MLELVNLANDRETEKILQATPHLLEEILTTHKLDGLEMIFCEPWNRSLFPKERIQGAHLIFWNDWLDFWREKTPQLLTRFENIQAVKNYYGATKPAEWVDIFKKKYQSLLLYWSQLSRFSCLSSPLRRDFSSELLLF